MLKGFKDFLLRGNVIDLAVAVIMGAAFSAIVTSLTDKILRPLLNSITPPTSPGMSVELVAGKPSTAIDLAAVITAVINFVMIAAVVYFVIVIPMRRLQARRKRGEESGPSEPTDIQLLTEIRDLLRGQTDSGSSTSTVDHGTPDGLSSSEPTTAGEDEPPLLTQPYKSVPAAPGAVPTAQAGSGTGSSGTGGSGTGGRQAVGPVGGGSQAIRPIGGSEQPVTDLNASEGGRHSARNSP